MSRATLEDACPAEDDIAAFLRGGLASRRVCALEAHVSGCPACRRLLSALARMVATGSHPAADSVSPTLPRDGGASEAELPIGVRFGRYIVLDCLGAGGMGVVYAAYDPELNRKVALKVLRNAGAGPGDRLPIHDELLREAQAMAQLAHPNVVTVFDVGSVDGRVFLAMELVEGVTLARWMRTERRERGDVLAAFLAAGSGLAAAHAAGLVHRDFKPDNVLVGNDGRVCVTDFGLARAAAVEPLEAAQGGAALPGPGANAARTGLAGTLAYMAPEQLLGRRADTRADQFSFAIALYEALYGVRPFAAPRLARDGTTARLVFATPRGRGVPRALRQVLLRALSPEPEDRYPSMAELLAALAPAPGPRRGRLIAGGAAVAVAVAVTAACGYVVRLRRAAEQRTELVGRLRGLAPEMRTQLRSAHMLPIHDILAARQDVRGAIRDVERQLQSRTGEDELALGYFVLGEGYRALGDHERALGLLEAAWAAGERGPHMDAALGYALGTSYETRLEQIEQTARSPHREAQIRAIEARYRDPAMAHLRRALAARAGSPAYLEALISFHQHRFAEASQRAHAAFVESPMLYEAGALEARAHSEAGRQLLAADKLGEATAEFATARRTFQRVLEIGRSDDEAWLAYGEMVFVQANALAHGELVPDLKQEAVTALHNVQRINPENGKAFLREAQIELAQGNSDLVWYRDPGGYVDKALALAKDARAHDADPAEVDAHVCVAYWERAAYQGTHGVDPHAAFEQAIAACERAAAARPDADNHANLGVLYTTLASYEGEHGNDPEHLFERAERNLRTAIGIDDDAGTHYNLAWLWTRVAQYQESHGQSPQRAVDHALAESEATIRLTKTRSDVWAGMSYALVVRARAQRAQHEDAEPTLARAHAALERAFALDANFTAAIKARIMISALDAEALLERNTDPTPVVAAMRADARLLVSRLPEDGAAHRLWSQAELLGARWAVAHRRGAEPLLTRAAAEAARARDDNAMDALAWTASAEVEHVRIEAARARGVAPSAAVVASGLAFIERAMTIDPRLARTLTLRDALVRQAHLLSVPVPIR